MSFIRSAERDLFASSGPSKDDKHGVSKNKGKALDRIENALLCDFFDESLSPDSTIRSLINNNTDRLTKFGDSLYLSPEYMPDIRGLKVARAGLKIGTFLKNRFEPDHALSHALKPSEAKHVITVDPASPEASNYLSGMTLPCDPSIKGWCLVCAGNFPLGWGKASGGTVKNHYPKGLRK